MTPEKRIEYEKGLFNYSGPDRVVSSVEYWELIKNQKPLAKFQTGLQMLDQTIDGFEAGEVIVIAGPTSMGKTLLCDTILRNLALSEKRGLVFTFENAPEKVVQEHQSPENAIYLPLEHKAMNLEWLKERCYEAKLKYGHHLSAVFIDHLQYIVDLTTRHNMSLEIGWTMRFIKQQLAVWLRLPVFVVSHITKLKQGEEPTMDHLRDSALVGCEADTVLMIYRRYDKDLQGKPLESMLQGLATIKVEKARRTGNIAQRIKVHKVGHRLEESLL